MRWIDGISASGGWRHVLLFALLAAPPLTPSDLSTPGRAGRQRGQGIILARAQFESLTEPPLPVSTEIEACARQREALGEKDPYCGMRWGVFNTARVPEFWTVHEVEFYWNYDCTARFAPGLAKSSQQNIATAMEEMTAAKAIDQDERTFWAAECNVITKGCRPWQHWIGMEIPEATSPLVLDQGQQYATLKCIRILQSPNATRMSQSIATVVWTTPFNDGYEVIAEYTDIASGFWTRRPARESALWRVRNAEATERPWTVGELLFYSDLFCTREVFGVPISSDAFGVPQSANETTYCYDYDKEPFPCLTSIGCFCDPHLAKYAFNGERLPGYPFPDPYPGSWQAPCNPFTGCLASEAWIGMDFGDDPRVVNCIRIHQPVSETWPTPGSSTFSSSLVLEGWSGLEWFPEQFFFDVGQGNWSDTRPENGFAWRLNNFDRMGGSWHVHELALYEEPNCGVVAAYSGAPGVALGGLPGTPISGNVPLTPSDKELQCRLTRGNCEGSAFDVDTFSSWVSDCSPCGQREAWIGLLFKNRPRQIRCFRLYQGALVDHSSEAIELSFWDGEEWVPERFEAGIGRGSWNHRPAESGTAYRLLGGSETQLPWTVSGLHFYGDSQCAGENIDSRTVPIGSGSSNIASIDRAFDFDPEGQTYWEASCPPPRPGSPGCAPGSTWLGIQGASTEPLDVRCIRLKQDRSRARQISSGIIEIFDGIKWLISDGTPALSDLGGGSWQTLPGEQGSMWRVAASPVPGGLGVGFSEVEFYRFADCSGEKVKANFPNIAPVSSGFASAREIADDTGYTAHYLTMGQSGFAFSENAFDGDLSSFWCDLSSLSDTQNGGEWKAWIGMDMTSQVTDVMCVRFALAPVLGLQAGWAELQAWDSTKWVSVASADTRPTLVIPLPMPSASGWQRRPAPKNTMWRIENQELLESWEVLELELYELGDCQGKPLVGWNAIGSAISADAGMLAGGHTVPGNAFDGSVSTRWASWCPETGCEAGQAWVGLNFEREQSVNCLRIFQSGRYERQARKLRLSVWNGAEWTIQAHFSGLGGNSWHMRPSAPDTQWRLTFLEASTDACETVLPARPIYKRSWGVTEFYFYGDDACTQEIQGEAIASGSWEDPLAADGIEADSTVALQFTAAKARDKDDATFWSASCKPLEGMRDAQCLEGEEWIGIDTSTVSRKVPMEVKCVRLVQSRALQRHCCDPAKLLRLDRWNGSDWTAVIWRHLKEDDSEPIRIEGTFDRLGQCPSITAKLIGQLDSSNPGIVETRQRRQSETCEIPLSGAIKLLTDSMCMKHPLCMDAQFNIEQVTCCPIGQSGSVSRCCCDIPGIKIFEDQWELGLDRRPLESIPIIGLEFVIIRIVTVMPWMGVIFSVIFFGLVSAPRPGRQSDSLGFRKRLWTGACKKAQKWLDDDKGKSLLAALTRILVKKQPEELLVITAMKRITFVCVGFFLGGAILWIVFAYLFASVVTRGLKLVRYVVKSARSPFNPKDSGQKKRLMLVLGLPQEEQVELSPSIQQFISSIVQSLASAFATFVRSVADVILLRFAFMNMGAVDINVSVVDIAERVPEFPIDLEIITSTIYWLLNLANKAYVEFFSTLFQGIPRCEGPVLTFSGMFLVGITLVLLRALNYDYFGLLLAVKGNVAKTKPNFQRGILLGTTLLVQTSAFMLLQMVMLLFSRALSMLFGVSLNPFETSEGWNCPYAGESTAIIVGRTFLLVTGLVGIIVTFLCANGHFLGKAQVTGDFGEQCGLDLRKLDTEGRTHRLIRYDAPPFAMFVTTFGLWFDDWNVKAYLIKERAEAYADGLHYPVECEQCGCYHIPYKEIMKATGLQVSLAWQLMPFIGPIVGKAAEYMNNPPVFYHGTRLKCFNEGPNLAKVHKEKQRKMGAGAKAKYLTMLFIAWIKDRGIGILKVLANISIYGCIVYYTYTIDKNNINEKAVQMFTVLMTLSALKGYLEFCFPVIFLALLAAAFFMFKSRVDKAEKKLKNEKGRYKATVEINADELEEELFGNRSILPLLGQTVHGVTVGGALASYFINNWPESSLNEITCIAAACGIGAGEFIACVALMFEILPGKNSMWANIFFLLYGTGLAIGAAWVGGHGFSVSAKVAIAVGTGIILLNTTAVCFRSTGYDDHSGGVKSRVKPLFTSFRIFPGPMGIFAGVSAVVMPYAETVKLLGSNYGFLLAWSISYVVGVVISFSMDAAAKDKPGRIAVLTGVVILLIVGFLFSWLFGALIGSVVATLVGAFFEKKQTEKIQKQNLNPAKYTRSKVTTSAALVDQVPPEEERDPYLDDKLDPTYVVADTRKGDYLPGAIADGVPIDTVAPAEQDDETRTLDGTETASLALPKEQSWEDRERRNEELALARALEHSPVSPAEAALVERRHSTSSVGSVSSAGGRGSASDAGSPHRRSAGGGDAGGGTDVYSPTGTRKLRPPEIAAARAREKRKKHGLGASAMSLSVPQGAPNYAHRPWQGPQDNGRTSAAVGSEALVPAGASSSSPSAIEVGPAVGRSSKERDEEIKRRLEAIKQQKKQDANQHAAVQKEEPQQHSRKTRKPGQKAEDNLVSKAAAPVENGARGLGNAAVGMHFD